MPKTAPTGAYSGRLSFEADHDSPHYGFHTDLDGNPVVTEDEGKTWRYAEEGDPSHFERYHQRFATVDGTANRLLELQLEHGREKAEELMREEQPHHFEVQSDDPHFDGVLSDPDHIAEKITGHTEAWA